MIEAPRLFVPPSDDGDGLDPTIQPEPWVWRYPAAVAIHNIVKLAVLSERTTVELKKGEKGAEIRTQLIPIAVKLAVNALYWDSIVLRQVLKKRGMENEEEWGKLFVQKSKDAEQTTEALDRTILTTDLVERESISRSNKTEKNSELENMEKAAQQMTKSYRNSFDPSPRHSSPISPRSSPSPPFELPPSSPIHLVSSLPPPTLEILFLYLVEQTPFPSSQQSALILSSTMSKLRIRRPLGMLQWEFKHALEGEEIRRIDVASSLLSEWVEEVQRTGKGRRRIEEAFRKLRKALMSRTVGNEFSTRPRKSVLAGVANLARLLDREWEKSKSPQERAGPFSPITFLVRLLVQFPKPLDEALLKASFKARASEGRQRRDLAKSHHEVYGMVQRVIGRVLEDVIQRPIYFGVSHVMVGEPLEELTLHPQHHPLKIEDYNNLIQYSLRQLSSVDIATSLVTSLQNASLSPNATTSNILLPYVSQSTAEAIDYIQNQPQNERTLPSFFSFTKQISDFTNLEKLVFAILPELDNRLPRAADAPESGYPDQSPPLPGRSPYLYVTILDALAKAGKTGLAERVFRSARWAAELSRKEPAAYPPPRSSEEGTTSTKVKPWVLPEHAFTIMLHLYSSEAERGRRAERRLSSSSQHPSIPSSATTPASPYVRGWGRHALRVFLRQERATRLRSALGSTTETRLPRDFSSPAPPLFLRSKAAPIVALWELRGGTKEQPELENLEMALTSPWNREACEKLFPGRVWGVEGLTKEWEGKREYRVRRRERRRDLKRMVRASAAGS